MCRHVIFTGNSDASTVMTSFEPEVVDPSPRKLHSVKLLRGSSYLPNLVIVALMWAEVAEEGYYILLPVCVILRPLQYLDFGDFSKRPNYAIFKITWSCPEFFALSNGTNVTIGTFYVTFGPFQHAVGYSVCQWPRFHIWCQIAIFAAWNWSQTTLNSDLGISLVFLRIAYGSRYRYESKPTFFVEHYLIRS